MIFIVGVPRSGKSTLAKMLKDKYKDANLFSCDAIKNSLANLKLSNGDSCATTTEEFLKFVVKLGSWNEVLTGQKSIIDAGNISIEDIYKVMTPEDRLVCLGFGGRGDKAEIWNSIKGHQKEFDYTCDMDMDKATRYWGDFGARDKNNRYFCVDKNLIYMDTNLNQENTLLFVVDLLKDDFE